MQTIFLKKGPKRATGSDLSLLTGGQRSGAVTYSIPTSLRCKSTPPECSCCAERAEHAENNSVIFTACGMSEVWAEWLVFIAARARNVRVHAAWVERPTPGQFTGSVG